MLITKTLSPKYLSVLSRELSLLLRTGLTNTDSLAMLRDNDDDKDSRVVLDYLYKASEKGKLLSEAMEESELFPKYMLGVVRLGEQTNKLDETLFSLSEYYNERSHLNDGLRCAIFYPILLISIMAAVFLVLITQVFPIFNSMYEQMNTQFSGISSLLINFGKWLSSASVVITILFALFLSGIALVYKIPSFRRKILGSYEFHYGAGCFWGQISASKFASAMSMAVSSGLDTKEAMLIAGDICRSSPGMCRRMSECKSYLDSGESVENCLSKSRIFSKGESRTLALGEKVGVSEYLMFETARQNEKKILDDLNLKLNKIEPMIVLVTSLIIGLLLLSVMLPLIGIISSIS